MITSIAEKLKTAGLRPTPQRLVIGNLLFVNGNRHITAETLHEEACQANHKVSLATVYNTLHQFTQAGLLKQVVVNSNKTYFDTNTSLHHHFFHEDSNDLEDIPSERLSIQMDGGDPFDIAVPEGKKVAEVGVIIRLAPDNQDGQP